MTLSKKNAIIPRGSIMRVSLFLLGLLLVVVMYLALDFYLGLQEHHEVIIEDVPVSLFIGLVAGTGGFADKSFNDSQYRGMILAKMEYDIDFIERSPNRMEDSYKSLKEVIDGGVHVVFAGGGFFMRESVDTLARQYPKIIFVLFDDDAIEHLPNVASVVFRQNEGSFLVGALAAMQTQTNTIGVITAMDAVVMNDCVIGFEAGVRYIKPGIKIIKEVIEQHDSKTDPFSNPQVAFDIASEMYLKKNVDIIFQVCRGSGLGVINASREHGKFSIGVMYDQDHLAKGNVLTSMEKKMDLGILEIVNILVNCNFENKLYSFGLKEGFISRSNLTYTKDLIGEANINKLNGIEKKIIKGEIVVPSVQERN